MKIIENDNNGNIYNYYGLGNLTSNSFHSLETSSETYLTLASSLFLPLPQEGTSRTGTFWDRTHSLTLTLPPPGGGCVRVHAGRAPGVGVGLAPSCRHGLVSLLPAYAIALFFFCTCL